MTGKTLHLGDEAMVRTEDSTAGELRLEKSYISWFSCDGELGMNIPTKSAVILILTQDSTDNALVVVGMQLKTTMLFRSVRKL